VWSKLTSNTTYNILNWKRFQKYSTETKDGWHAKEARDWQQGRTTRQRRARCTAGWFVGNGAIGRL
jgi:hypothetical protein